MREGSGERITSVSGIRRFYEAVYVDEKGQDAAKGLFLHPFLIVGGERMDKLRMAIIGF